MFFISKTDTRQGDDPLEQETFLPGQFPEDITDGMRPALESIMADWRNGKDIKGESHDLSTPCPQDRYMSSEDDTSSSADESCRDADVFESDLEVDNDDQVAEDIYEMSTTIQEVKADVARRVSLIAPGKPKLVIITVSPLQTPQHFSRCSIDEAIQPSRSRSSSVYSDCAESFDEIRPLEICRITKSEENPMTEPSTEQEVPKPEAISKPTNANDTPTTPPIDSQLSKRRRSETITPPRTPPISATLAPTTPAIPPQSKFRGFARSFTFAKRSKLRRAKSISDRSQPPQPDTVPNLPTTSNFVALGASHHLFADKQQRTVPPSPPSTPPARNRLRRRSSVLGLGIATNRMSFMQGDDRSELRLAA
ncbi:MAG: hypothetical protein M4579_001506 [Chaenotheca gracillima]|nr:MAG: hypothetical protein M4579_001506 [Chaenotheca gracillima]